MAVSSLSLTNFRSYTDQTLALDPVITLVVGPNATGKTNLLEGLFVLATTKSFRAKDGELVRHGQDFYRLMMGQDGTEMTLSYQAGPNGTEKRARHNNTPRSLIDHLGSLRVVLFEPNDLLLINGAPERRRRYLDFILIQTIPGYAKTLSHYRRVLSQRNRLLADWRGANNELFAWNLRLAELATEINNSRRELIDHINDLVGDCYRNIAGSAESVKLSYQGAAGTDFATTFLQLLEDNLSRDIAAGFTTIGPHRDDFTIQFKDAPITAVASRGEMRTVVLALKMAELAYIERQTESRPMLLLDDVFSELDDSRRRYLLDTLGGYQSVITTTNADVSDELSAKHTTILTQELQRV